TGRRRRPGASEGRTMKSNVWNAVPTGTKGPSPDATVAETMVAMAELAQQNRSAAKPATTSTQARDSMRPVEPAQQGRRAAAPPATPAAVRGGPPGVSDSMRAAAIAGWAIIAIFFGGFGAWAVTAPLHGAVVANGFVRVEGMRKSIQHLDGGIVKELNVKEGDRVNAG